MQVREFLRVFFIRGFTAVNFLSEMFEARRWNMDSRFQAPMITSRDKERVFLESFVDVADGYGKIKKFFIKVQLMHDIICMTKIRLL